MTRIALEPYFMHQEQVQALIGPQRTISALAQVASRGDPEAAPYVLAAVLAEALPALGIRELLTIAHEQDIHAGQVIGVEQELTFVRARNRDAPGVRLVDFECAIDADARKLDKRYAHRADGAPSCTMRRFRRSATLWSGTGSNCRPSAFQVNRAKRCADLL